MKMPELNIHEESSVVESVFVCVIKSFGYFFKWIFFFGSPYNVHNYYPNRNRRLILVAVQSS